MDCKAYVGGRRERLVHTIANDGRRENGLAKEAADVWDLIRQDYTPAQIARAKSVSEKHIADLLALQRLDPTLFAEFSAGRLKPAVGYRLGREPSRSGNGKRGARPKPTSRARPGSTPSINFSPMARCPAWSAARSFLRVPSRGRLSDCAVPWTTRLSTRSRPSAATARRWAGCPKLSARL
ncbi:hypothetical protein [Nannocystis pusilla]|uniref:hypothetical protein n=1 Tax=Nannocystis pusilla TaxID=889268 RepID=UPI003B7BC6A2